MSPRREHEGSDGGEESPPAAGFVIQPRPHPPGLLARMRTYFLTGVVVTAPFGITFLLVWQFISFLDTRVESLIPAQYNPENYLPFSLPGLGLIVTIAFLTMVGMFTAGFVGRAIVRMGEQLLARMPIVRSVYATLKQIFQTVLAQSSRSFREVVLIEYPRRGIAAIGFVTGPTQGEIQDRSDEELVNVFLPTTPNPTSGFLLFVPKSDLIHLDMTIEEGIKLVISGGIVTPPGPTDREAPAQPVPLPPEIRPAPDEPAEAPRAARVAARVATP